MITDLVGFGLFGTAQTALLVKAALHLYVDTVGYSGHDGGAFELHFRHSVGEQVNKSAVTGKLNHAFRHAHHTFRTVQRHGGVGAVAGAERGG